MAYAHLPIIETSTPTERLQALKDAKELMSGGGPGGIMAAIGGTKTTPGTSIEAISGFLRLAEYITTGHDYLDTHPTGKRRPIINQHNITVVAPPIVDADDMEHLMSHLEDGSFVEFMEDMMKQRDPFGVKAQDPFDENGSDGDAAEGPENSGK